MQQVRAKKNLGQHFLNDLGAAQAIVDGLQPDGRYKEVLEIGPGMGVLTQFLLKKTDYTTHLIEIDTESVAYLRKNYLEFTGPRLIEGDFLRYPLEKIFEDRPFAIVGNFEGAVYAWRYLTQKWADPLSAVILAAGGGALGVRLGEPLSEPDSDEALRMAEAGEPLVYEVGLEPTERSMRSAVGLVWRLVIAWMILLLMLTIALWLG